MTDKSVLCGPVAEFSENNFLHVFRGIPSFAFYNPLIVH